MRPHPRTPSMLCFLPLLFLASVGLLGCGEGDAPTDPTDPIPPQAETNVGPAGGTVTSDDGTVTVTFPPGALAAAALVTIAPLSDPPPFTVPGTAYTLAPTALSLSSGATLRITHSTGSIPEGAIRRTVGIHHFDDGNWTRVPGSEWDPGASAATTSISGLGGYAILFPGMPSEVDASGDAQAGVVGEALPQEPMVTVRSESGAPIEGVHVLFQVEEGEGVVDDPSPYTNAQGQASPGQWVLGSRPGEHRLVATVETLDEPITFMATAEVGPPSRLVAAAGNGASGPLGGAPSPLPVVRVEDSQGNPLEGVVVHFARTEGEGAFAPAETTTDASGEVRITQFVLDSPGTHKLVATVEEVPDPLTFMASAASGVPSVLGFDEETSTSNTGAQAFPGEPLGITPRWVVLGERSERVEGVIVRFRAETGGQVRDSMAVTDENGLASPGLWYMGRQGQNRLVAEVEGLNPSVQIVRTLNPCHHATPAALGTIEGTLEEGRECVIAGRHVRLSAIDFPEGGAVSAQVTASPGNAAVTAREAGGARNIATLTTSSATSPVLRVVVPPGESWFGGGGTSSGPYRLSIEMLPEPEFWCTGFLGTVLAFGATAVGTIAQGDCTDESGERFDTYRLPSLEAGETVSFRLQAQVPMRAEVWDGSRGFTSSERLLIVEAAAGEEVSFESIQPDGQFSALEVRLFSSESGGYSFTLLPRGN